MEIKEQISALEELMRDHDDPSKLDPELQRYVEEGGEYAKYRLRHPLVYSVMGPLLPHQCNEMFREKKKLLKEMQAERNWHQYLWLHERPYRMEALEFLFKSGRITRHEMREVLLDFWTDTEIPQGNQAEPLFLFRESRFVTDDQEGFDKLPSRMKLWRGVDGVCELTADGPSWTRSRKVAEFFAKRYAKGQLYSIYVRKDHPAVLAWITNRDEAEIILDFDKLDVGQIKLEHDFSKED